MSDTITLLGDDTTLSIAYDSVIEAATLTYGGTTDTDGDVENLLGWQEYTWWKPTGGGTYTVEADLGGSYEVGCFALFGHDCTGLVAMDTWDGAAWQLFGSVNADGSGAVLYVQGTALTTTKLRFRFASLTYLAVLFAGPEITTPRGVKEGWSDPRLGQMARVEPEVSRDGLWLGTTIEEWMHEQQVSISDVDYDWAVDYWRPFQNACSAQPCFLHWNPTDNPDSACYCTGLEFSANQYARRDMVDLGFTAKMRVGSTP